jgi:CheY-like chemotaxis protein
MFSSNSPFGVPTEPLSVVVADDVQEIRDLVEKWLRGAGCSVMSAASGSEVSRLLRSQQFDLIITDVIMPDGDGLEVISDARRLQPKARVLAISGGGNHLPAQDCLMFAKGLGANAVLLKPFNRERLLDAVSHVAPTPRVA